MMTVLALMMVKVVETTTVVMVLTVLVVTLYDIDGGGFGNGDL